MPLTDRFLLGGIAAAIVLGGVATWLLFASLAAPAGVALDPSASPAASLAAGSSAPLSTAAPDGRIVVDVEGAVEVPGIQSLPAGARLADAVAAAGGYADDADLVAAAHALNLAAELSDGDQVYVPRVGEGSGGGGDGGGGGSGGPGLVSLNDATPEQLDALPGIGPVTVGKIVAAREEQPFTTLEELVERKVMTTAQLDGIRDLVTV